MRRARALVDQLDRLARQHAQHAGVADLVRCVRTELAHQHAVAALEQHAPAAAPDADGPPPCPGRSSASEPDAAQGIWRRYRQLSGQHQAARRLTQHPLGADTGAFEADAQAQLWRRTALHNKRSIGLDSLHDMSVEMREIMGRGAAGEEEGGCLSGRRRGRRRPRLSGTVERCVGLYDGPAGNQGAERWCVAGFVLFRGAIVGLAAPSKRNGLHSRLEHARWRVCVCLSTLERERECVCPCEYMCVSVSPLSLRLSELRPLGLYLGLCCSATSVRATSSTDVGWSPWLFVTVRLCPPVQLSSSRCSCHCSSLHLGRLPLHIFVPLSPPVTVPRLLPLSRSPALSLPASRCSPASAATPHSSSIACATS